MTNDNDNTTDGEEVQNKQLIAWFKAAIVSLLTRIKATVDQSVEEIAPQLSGALSGVRIPATAIKPLALAGVLILAAVAVPAAPMFGPSEGALNGTTDDPAIGQTYEELGDSDFRQVVTSRLGSDAEAPPAPSEVRTSAGSQTMQIETTVRDGDPAIVLEDDRTHEGRWVSIDTAWFEEHVGEVPQQAQIEHETDGSYSTPIQVRGSSAAFYVQGFSTNTVTFDGEFSLSANPAVDGDTISYDAPNGGENLKIDLTGVVAEKDTTVGLDEGSNTIDAQIHNGSTTGTLTASVPNTSQTASGDIPADNTASSVGDTVTVDSFGTSGEINVTAIRATVDDANDGDNTFKILLDGTQWSDFESSTLLEQVGKNDDNRLSTDPTVAFEMTESAGNTVTFETVEIDYIGESGPATYTIDGSEIDLSDGESNQVNISEDTVIDVSHPDSSVSPSGELNYTATTATTDPSISLNGNSAGYDGTLADGETTSLSANDSWIEEGTNDVSVSLPSVENDPQPQVAVDVKHDVAESRTIDYSAEAFSERYSTSKTWAENTSNATLTIPWASSNVIAVRNVDVEYSEGGEELTTHPSPSYELDNNELVVDLGDVESGWTTTISADGSKVQVSGADLEVLNATDEGEDLNSDIRLNNPSDDVYLRVGETDQGQQLHYLANASWSNEEVSQISADGTNEMRIPDAPDNGETTIRTLPLAFNVGSGEIDVDIPDDRVNNEEPVYRIGPGSSSGDNYDVTFTEAADSQDYVLWDETDEIVLDSGTASSPLTLSASDPDEPHILQFREDDGSATSSGGSTSDGGIAPMVTTSSPFSGLSGLLPGRMTVLLALASLVGLGVVARTTPLFNEGTRSDAVADATVSVGKRVGGLIERAFDNEIIIAALTLGGGVWLLTSGAFTASERLIISLGTVPIAMFLILQQFDQFDIRIWIGSTALVGVLGLQQLAPEVFTTVADEAGIIIAVGAIVLGWRALSAYRAAAETPNEVNRIEIRGDDDDDDN